MKTKKCRKCKQEKNIDCFGKYATAKDGLKPLCKECLNTEHREYHIRNKERDSQRGKEYRQKYPEKGAIYIQDRRTYRPKIHIVIRTRSRAKRLGIEFTITDKDFEIPTHCPILGIELCTTNHKLQDNSISIDRIDPTRGYVPGNVAIISNRANTIKNSGTADEHRKVADFIDKNMQKA